MMENLLLDCSASRLKKEDRLVVNLRLGLPTKKDMGVLVHCLRFEISQDRLKSRLAISIEYRIYEIS